MEPVKKNVPAMLQASLIFVAWSLVPTLVFVFILSQFVPFGIMIIKSKIDMLRAITTGPLIETAAMAFYLDSLRKLLKERTIVTCVISSASWGLFHSLFNIYWGIVILWPFFIFSIAYTRWSVLGRWWGYAAATTTHALHNAIAIALAFLLR
ncbi:hypothetical protein [Mizugakiibacter sediminis]|uniref:hypothetical protein n=1 Tax=Mizugakiibacter sediminis TaxID=1475481 RepID=UPI0011E4CA7D|nr:hypothetical protein [Mizugakiibacter sediminis]